MSLHLATKLKAASKAFSQQSPNLAWKSQLQNHQSTKSLTKSGKFEMALAPLERWNWMKWIRLFRCMLMNFVGCWDWKKRNAEASAPNKLFDLADFVEGWLGSWFCNPADLSPNAKKGLLVWHVGLLRPGLDRLVMVEILASFHCVAWARNPECSGW